MPPDASPLTYKMIATCRNCRKEQEVEIPRGMRTEDFRYACIYCGEMPRISTWFNYRRPEASTDDPFSL